MKVKLTLARIALIAAAVSIISFSAAAQEKKITARQVPAPVMSAFKTAYPKATIRGYAQEKENGKLFYEIESREGTMSRDVLYNPDGTVAEVEESISTSDRSVTRISSVAFHTSLMSFEPSSSTFLVRKTAQLDCIARCMRSRSLAVGLEPCAWRK